MFGVALILTDPEYGFVYENCTQVGEYIHVYEGDLELFTYCGLYYDLISFGSVCGLGDMPKHELQKYIKYRFAISDERWESLEKQGKSGLARFNSGERLYKELD
jgi:hypothetical protein